MEQLHIQFSSLKKRAINFQWRCLILLFAFSLLLSGTAAAQFAGGNGTSSNPYLITTAAQLDAVRNNLSAHYKLGNNIDLTAYLASGGDGYAQWGDDGWMPIGSYNPPILPFSGSFDGDGYAIIGLRIDRNMDEVGLFGATGGAIIKNLGVDNADISGQMDTGGLVGSNINSIIENCYANVSMRGGPSIGGLTGCNYQSTIRNCYANSNIQTLLKGVGGLTGYNDRSIIENCYAVGNLSSDIIIGGLVGRNIGSTILNSYAAGSVSGEDLIGGLVGENDQSIIQNCVAANASLTALAPGAINRIVGSNGVSNTYHNNYANSAMVVQINGVPTTIFDDLTVNGTGMPMTTLKTFAFYNTPSNWYIQEWDINDPSGIWDICDNATLPFLRWQEHEPCPVQFCGGDGTPSNPYLICTPEQLDAVRYFLSSHFKVMNNIDLTAYLAPGGAGYAKWGDDGWMPIGNATTPFSGSFDGAGYIITGLTIMRSTDNVGLFGFTNEATIKNIGIENCNIYGVVSVGGLVGLNKSSTIESIYVTGEIIGTRYIGGLAGQNTNNAIIQNCYTTANVSGDMVGGLVGRNHESTIQNSYAAGNVSGEGVSGGLVGNNSTSIIQNCVAANTLLTNTVTTLPARISSHRIAGANSFSTYHNNYANSAMVVQMNGVPITIFDDLTVNGTGMPMSVLKKLAFYNTPSNWQTAAWDINDPSGIWKICDNETLPFLRWEEHEPCTPPGPPCGSGDGTPSNPYLICTPEQLDSVRYFLSSHFKLKNDIDLTAYLAPGGAGYAQWGTAGWMPIGIFSGSLDGAGYAIIGLRIDRSMNDLGLFGATNGASIKSLGIKHCDIKGFHYVGGLVGVNTQSIIENCYAVGKVNGRWVVGGLVGSSAVESIIQNCYSAVDVTGSHHVSLISGFAVAGGLVGAHMGNSIIRNCYVGAGIVKGGSLLGGLVGQHGYSIDISSTIIENSYAANNLIGDSEIGGLVGAHYSPISIVQNCAAINTSLVANAESSLVANANRLNRIVCQFPYNVVYYYNNYANKAMEMLMNGVLITRPDNILNGIGKSIAELQSETFYTTASNWRTVAPATAWDFTNIWQIWDGKSYPYFQWQSAPVYNPQYSGSNISFELRNNADKIVVYNSNTQQSESFGPLAAGVQVRALSLAHNFDELLITVYESGKISSYPAQVQYFCGGDGTPNSPYLICNAEQLDLVRHNLSAHYKLNNDIDLTNYLAGGGGHAQWGNAGWLPIGNAANPFAGSFEGDGYSITGLKINRTDMVNIGLFGATNRASIKNLGIENCNIAGNINSTGSWNIGGLVGWNRETTIENCYVKGSISGTWLVGGLVGQNVYTSIIRNSYFDGNLSGNYEVGGLAGSNFYYSTIENSYAAGNINAKNLVGGLVGFNSESLIQNTVVAVSQMIASTPGGYVNRITGVDGSGSIYRNNYANSAMAVLVAGAPLPIPNNDLNGTDASMDILKELAFYNTAGNWHAAAWDIDDPSGVWKICDNTTLPFLRWEQHAPCYMQPSCGGNGTIGNPYLICTAEQLDAVRYNLSAHYKLNNNIDLTDYLAPGGAGYAQWDSDGWLPIGSLGMPFTGSIDGDGHAVTGLQIDRLYMDEAGLFGYIESATVKNIGIGNCKVNGNDYVGGLAGYCNQSIVENSYVTGTLNGNAIIGGLVGMNHDNSTIKNSYANVSISGNESVGGLVGQSADNSIVENCYANGSANGGNSVGGLLGSELESIIQNCAAVQSSITGTMMSFSFLNIALVHRIAGLEGKGFYHNNYANADMMIQINGRVEKVFDDLTVNGTGKPAADLQGLNFYDAKSKEHILAWDIAADDSQIWTIWDNKSYPYFPWQSAPVYDPLHTGEEISFELRNPADSVLVYNFSTQETQKFTSLSAGKHILKQSSITDLYDILQITVYEPDKAPSYPVNALFTAVKSKESSDETEKISITADKQVEVKAYPNPVSAWQTLYIAIDMEEELLQGAVIDVYSISGNHLSRIKVRGRLTPIHINYATGIYSFVLHGKGGLRKDLRIIIN